MSLENSTSRVIHKGNGSTKVFSFSFKVWEPSQVRVMLADSAGTETDVTGSVSVAITATGGTVTFTSAPATGTTLAILRQMPFVQEDVYITGTRFDPHEIEEALDIACAERQELRELALRHLAVPATSSRTPQEVMEDILGVADQANEYLGQVIEIRDDVQELKNNAQALIVQTGDEQAARIDAVGDAEVQDVENTGTNWQATVQTEGEVQLARLAGYADVGALAEGLAAACQVWTLGEDIPAGTTIVLPNELRYIPGHHHLWLSYGGMVLSPTFFTEVGESTETSTKFITNVSFKAGQELMAWVIPLGKAYEVELTDRIVALEDALAQLSQTVAYVQNTMTQSEA